MLNVHRQEEYEEKMGRCWYCARPHKPAGSRPLPLTLEGVDWIRACDCPPAGSFPNIPRCKRADSLDGLLRCWRCGQTMLGQSNVTTRVTWYVPVCECWRDENTEAPSNPRAVGASGAAASR